MSRSGRRARLTEHETSRHECERVNVRGSDDGEVAPVERGDRVESESFRDGNDGRVSGAKRKIGILLDQLSHAE